MKPANPSGTEFSRVDRRLRRLAAAVLIQAVRDLDGRSGGCSQEARRWISRKDVGLFSFDLCCTILGRKPEPLRQRLLGDAPERQQVARSASQGRV